MSGDDLSASAPAVVQVSSASGVRGASLDKDGAAAFTALRGQRFTVTFPQVLPRASSDPSSGQVARRPVGLSELRLDFRNGSSTDSTRVRTADVRVATACGDGPTLQVGSRRFDTRVESTLGDVRSLAPTRAVPCGSDAVSLASGASRVVATATPLWQPASISIQPVARPAPPAAVGQPAVQHWAADSRSLSLPASDTKRVVVVHENENIGWRATIGGVRLAPVVIDGWQQGYVVPAGLSGRVQLVHAGDRPYRLGLVLGLALALMLVVAAAIPDRVRDPRVTGPSTTGPVLRALLATGVLLAFGGWLGLAAGGFLVGLGATLGRLAWDRGTTYVGIGLAAVSLVTMTAAGALTALHPWGVSGDYAGNELPVTSLAVVSLAAALAAWVLSGGSRPGPAGRVAARLRQRIAGSSTNR